MKIAFVAGLYPKQVESYYFDHSKNSTLQNAPNVFQWAVVRGLKENNCDFTVISYPSLPSFFSGYKELHTKASVITYSEETIGYSPRYCTMPFLKEISIRRSLKNELVKWIKINSLTPNDRFAILTYHLHGPILDAVSDLKKEYPNLVFCSILTDRLLRDPQGLGNTNVLKRIQSLLQIKSINRSIPLMNGFVLLAKRLIEYVPEAKERNIIIEGIAEHIPPPPQIKEEESMRTLLYTGSLGIHTSIDYLVKSFHEIPNQNFQLIICGDGALRQQIIDYARIDPRIIFKGSVPRDEALELQKYCTALINPRRPEVPDTPYSFPSKTIEYMLSGTPMIGYKLEGIPEEYYEYYYTIPDGSPEVMKDVIMKVLSAPNSLLYEKALSAYRFISEKKTAKIQIKRLLDFLDIC